MEYKLQLTMTEKEARWSPADKKWLSSVTFASAKYNVMPEVECDVVLRFLEKSIVEKLDPHKVYEITIREVDA